MFSRNFKDETLLLSLCFSIKDVAQIIGIDFNKLRAEVRRRGGVAKIVPEGRPTKHRDIYKARFLMYAKVGTRNLLSIKVRDVLREAIGYDEAMMFTRGLAAGQKALFAGSWPAKFEPFAEILGFNRRIMRGGYLTEDQVMSSYLHQVRAGITQAPGNIWHFRGGLVNFFRKAVDRDRVIMSFPGHMYHTCMRILNEMSDEHDGVRKIDILCKAYGIDYDIESKASLGRAHGISTRQVFRILTVARTEFRKRLYAEVDILFNGNTTFTNLIHWYNIKSDELDEVSRAHDKLQELVNKCGGRKELEKIAEAIQSQKAYKLLSMDISDFIDGPGRELTVHACYALRHSGVQKIWQIVIRSEAEWLAMPGLSKIALAEIRDIFIEAGLKFGARIPLHIQDAPR